VVGGAASASVRALAKAQIWPPEYAASHACEHPPQLGFTPFRRALEKAHRPRAKRTRGALTRAAAVEWLASRLTVAADAKCQ